MTSEVIMALCAFFIGLQDPQAVTPPGQLDVCLEVADVAQRHEVPVELALSLAWNESRFVRDAQRASGRFRGAFQIAARWYCQSGKFEGCDLIERGLLGFKRWFTRHPKWATAVCHFNQGNVCRRDGKWAPRWRWAQHVERQAKQARRHAAQMVADGGNP